VWLRYEGDYGIPNQIALTSKDPSVPLPNPGFLWVHFRVAEILEVSGLGRAIIDAVEQGTWDPENLDPGGSSDIGSILSRKMLIDI